MKNSNASSGGIGLVSALGIVFVVLKLTGHIDWSWWWVTAPFWGGIALGLSLVIIGGGMIILINKLFVDKSISADEYAKKMNERNPNYIPKRSKFQERMEDMQRQQLINKNKRTN